MEFTELLDSLKLGIVLRHAKAVLVHEAEADLAFGVTPLGRNGDSIPNYEFGRSQENTIKYTVPFNPAPSQSHSRT